MTIFGLRDGPDGEMVYVGSSRDPVARVAKLRKIGGRVGLWLKGSPGAEIVPLGESDDKLETQLLVTEERAKLGKDSLCMAPGWKRGQRRTRRGRKPGKAKDGPLPAPPLTILGTLGAHGWTLDEEVKHLVSVASDNDNIRQLAAIAMLRELRDRAEAARGAPPAGDPSAAMWMAKAKETRDGEGADQGAEGAGGGGAKGPEGRGGRVQGGGVGGADPGPARPGRGVRGEGAGREEGDGEPGSRAKPVSAIPGFGGLAGRRA